MEYFSSFKKIVDPLYGESKRRNIFIAGLALSFLLSLASIILPSLVLYIYDISSPSSSLYFSGMTTQFFLMFASTVAGAILIFVPVFLILNFVAILLFRKKESFKNGLKLGYLWFIPMIFISKLIASVLLKNLFII